MKNICHKSIIKYTLSVEVCQVQEIFLSFRKEIFLSFRILKQNTSNTNGLRA